MARGIPKARRGKSMLAWRSRQKRGAIMRPSTFRKIKQQGNMGPRSVARQQQVVLIGLLHVPNTVRGERNKMPYSRFKRGAKYCLRNKRTGKVRCFGSKRKRENWARMAEAIVHGFKPRKKK